MSDGGAQMFILSGKSCSGKNEVSSELEKRGYKRCITYTTRPARNDEKQHVDYHFVNEKDFEKLQNDGFFIECERFDTEFGVYYYGIAKADFANISNNEKKFIILTPGGVKNIKKSLQHRFPVIYLFANTTTTSKRLKERGDNSDEAKRRMNQDKEDFKNFELVADRIVYNNYNNDILEVVDKIETHLEKLNYKRGDE